MLFIRAIRHEVKLIFLRNRIKFELKWIVLQKPRRHSKIHYLTKMEKNCHTTQYWVTGVFRGKLTNRSECFPAKSNRRVFDLLLGAFNQISIESVPYYREQANRHYLIIILKITTKFRRCRRNAVSLVYISNQIRTLTGTMHDHTKSCGRVALIPTANH